MRLANFISANIEPILAEWESFARSVTGSAKLGKLALRDDAESILRATVRDMECDQSRRQQSSKSKGHGGAGGDASDKLDDASSLHGVDRVGSGFDLNEVVSEYRALRGSVLRLWHESGRESDVNDLNDVTRFNECIDQSLAEGVASYTQHVDQTRRTFLAILAHDLRNPLSTISLSAQFALLHGSLPSDSRDAISQIETSVQAVNHLISDLTDFASTGLGAGIPIEAATVDLEALGREVAGEIQAAHPARRISCSAHGDLTLIADDARLRQVMSNLLGNAMQHGASDVPVTLTLAGEDSEVVLSVHNGGVPIPADLIPTIFDPLVRGNVSPTQRRPGSLGLGLYIVREIVTAHGGSVDVTSSESTGTLFIAHIPRRPPER